MRRGESLGGPSGSLFPVFVEGPTCTCIPRPKKYRIVLRHSVHIHCIYTVHVCLGGVAHCDIFVCVFRIYIDYFRNAVYTFMYTL